VNHLSETVTSMPVLFDRMFKGATRGLKVMSKSGLNKIINGRAVAVKEIENISKEYIKNFFDKKANGEKFNTAYNDAERGIASDLMRTLIGTEQQMKKEFDRRVGILKQSIEELSKGNKEQVKRSKIYQKVYDKIVEGSEGISDIRSKIDKVNLEAIDYWKKIHEDKFEALSDYMLNVHNTVLDKSLNYSSPDRYARISATSDKPLDLKEPMYGRDGELLYKKEASGLDESTLSKYFT